MSHRPSSTPGMGSLPGIESIAPDFVLDYVPTEASSRMPLEGIHADAQREVAGSWDNETFYSFQWAPVAIQAPEAWAAGHRGQGVRVAILDGAIHRTDIDLAANIDQAHSRSFMPTTIANWDWFQDVGTFWHGTHVISISATGPWNWASGAHALDDEVGGTVPARCRPPFRSRPHRR